MQKETRNVSSLYVVLGCLFVTCLLISNIIAGKLISVLGMVLPAAVILFPVTYIFGDILTEVYGFKRSRLIIWTGFACNLLMAAVFMLVVALPHPDFWQSQNAYQVVLGMTPRVVVASLIAYFLGEFCNSAVLSKMKLLTRGKWLFTRTIGSTIVGEGIDTAVFITIAFAGTVTVPVLFSMMAAQYAFKVLYEIAATPLTYLVVGWVKKKEEVDAYDWDVEYNPFSLEID
ncbi:MAG: queuosine precursor transporter [Syntrophaceticus sp.]